METFFTRLEHPMPAVPDDGRVPTEPFLKAAKQIVPFFDSIGAAFLPVKSDIDGNIRKLEKKHTSNPEKYRTLQDMLEDEVAAKQCKSSSSATVSLLWLKRRQWNATQILPLSKPKERGKSA